jgi:hypothetical protein
VPGRWPAAGPARRTAAGRTGASTPSVGFASHVGGHPPGYLPDRPDAEALLAVAPDGVESIPERAQQQPSRAPIALGQADRGVQLPPPAVVHAPGPGHPNMSDHRPTPRRRARVASRTAQATALLPKACSVLRRTPSRSIPSEPSSSASLGRGPGTRPRSAKRRSANRAATKSTP